jgi:sugar lactone lactonase YvrE
VGYENTGDTIEKFNSSGISGDNTDAGAFTTSNTDTPNGIAFDSAGNLYVANAGGNNITEFSSSGAYLGVYASGLSSPSGLVIDKYGDLFVANNGNGTITEIIPGGSETTFATGLSAPNGLAFGSNGDLFVANGGNNTIEEIPTSGSGAGVPILFATANTMDGVTGVGFSGLNDPEGIASDNNGNLYVANMATSDDGIEEFSSAGAALGVFASQGLESPNGVAFDSSGDLFVSNYSHNGAIGTGTSNIEEFSSTGTLLDTFYSPNLHDGGYIAIESSGSPDLPPGNVPEPSNASLITLGTASLIGFSWLRRRRRGI